MIVEHKPEDIKALREAFESGLIIEARINRRCGKNWEPVWTEWYELEATDVMHTLAMQAANQEFRIKG